MTAPVAIVGAGLCGNLLAIVLARQGLAVTVYDRGHAPDADIVTAGRSINLALAARGIRALEEADVYAAIEPLLLPMTGRIVHAADGGTSFLPYGQKPHERIWSVSRAGLNRELYTIARDEWQVEYRFEHECVGFDPDTLAATFRSPAGAVVVEAELLLAADGAGSTIRRHLAAAGKLEVEEDLLDHGYKELTIPALDDGGFALDAAGLHIWPRGGYMLIALPNLDRSFTATLFLPHRGDPGFDTLSPATIETLFAAQFPDAVPLLPGLREQFAERPVGSLGTVHCAPWSAHAAARPTRQVLLVGDAAHAIVPFHGQGMNAAFEDCAELGRLIGHVGAQWTEVVAGFEAARMDNAGAIARMALENYREMRDTVRDPMFERRAALAFELEQRHPGRFIPRYSMVMFHPEIGYADAERRGRIQAQILDEVMHASDSAAGLELAAALVEQRL
jgi:kynurenine 3-monooxygenase